jgi:vacuolar iron transporter family protein
VMSMEEKDRGKYDASPAAEAAALSSDEQSHSRLLRAITASSPGGVAGGQLARLEGRHRVAGGNALRAAVLGANDGLVSNLSLVMGVAGANLAPSAILVTGLSGLIAGAASMALGEWLSVQSSRELFASQVKAEKAELEAAPGEEAEELALIYQAKGLPRAQAEALSQRLMGDRGTALDTLVREELGIDPDDLGGSAWTAAITSFVLFAVGALVPVLPFLFTRGRGAVLGSLLASTAGLFTLGAGATLFTRRAAWWAGLRQVLFGLTAAGITWGVGHLIGVDLLGR